MKEMKRREFLKKSPSYVAGLAALASGASCKKADPKSNIIEQSEPRYSLVDELGASKLEGYLEINKTNAKEIESRLSSEDELKKYETIDKALDSFRLSKIKVIGTDNYGVGVAVHFKYDNDVEDEMNLGFGTCRFFTGKHFDNSLMADKDAVLNELGFETSKYKISSKREGEISETYPFGHTIGSTLTDKQRGEELHLSEVPVGTRIRAMTVAHVIMQLLEVYVERKVL